MSTIVITGRNGFIGNALASKLKNNHKIVSVIRRKKEGIDYKTEIIVEQDIGLLTASHLAQFKPDTVVHLAAEIFANPKTKYTNNIDLTSRIIRICSDLDLPLIFSSSINVVNASPMGPYARSKLDSEKLIRKYCKNYSIIRLPFVLANNSPVVCSIRRFVARWHFLPIIGNQLGQVQPVPLSSLIGLIQDIVESGAYEDHEITIAGTKTYTYREIWEEISLIRGERVPVILLPVNLVSVLARIAELFNLPISLGLEQINSLSLSKVTNASSPSGKAIRIDNDFSELLPKQICDA